MWLTGEKWLATWSRLGAAKWLTATCREYDLRTAVPVNKVKLWNQQHVLFCGFTIKETNFVSILVVYYSLQLSEVAAATTNTTDLSRHEYDWRLWLSHVNMTDSDLTKYDWRRRLGDGGSGDYYKPHYNVITRHHTHLIKQKTSIMNNSISSRQTQINQNARHTIKSLKTKQFLDTFVIARSVLIENSNQELLPECHMQKLLYNINFTLSWTLVKSTE